MNETQVHDNSGSDSDTEAHAVPGPWQRADRWKRQPPALAYRGIEQPKPGFEVGDAVSTSVREGAIIRRSNFKVAASRECPEQRGSQRKWEYQLEDDDGGLHADGAWFQGIRDELRFQ
ncbi:hypothetical protein MBLNU13_g09367t1 [Cladosporium sp. NU13]